ncbi:hypothetical protein K435DRAFT_562272, partial [Dendrothele bispora CBS 962.96]
DVGVQMAYVEQQRLDGYDLIVKHALTRKRKEAFDRRVLRRAPGEVIFQKGQLVQIRREKDGHRAENKLMPRWSVPHRVVEQ